jgi:hypothetical protein
VFCLCNSPRLAQAASGAAGAAPLRVVIELDVAETVLDARMVRRLIHLELSEVEVPPDPRRPGNWPPTLFVRIVSAGQDAVDVELWERGVSYGKRTVSRLQGRGGLRARRVALAAAELARRMRHERLAQAKRLREERRRRQLQEQRLAETPPFARLALQSTISGGAVGPGDLWLLGPRLAGQIRFRSGIRLELGSAWMFGKNVAAEGHPTAQWLELSVGAGYATNLGKQLGLSFGAHAAAAAVHLAELDSVDSIRGQADSWSASALADVRLETRLASGLRLSFGPSAGMVLRPIPVVDESGNSERLGGLWLGGAVGVDIDPQSRR